MSHQQIVSDYNAAIKQYEDTKRIIEASQEKYAKEIRQLGTKLRSEFCSDDVRWIKANVNQDYDKYSSVRGTVVQIQGNPVDVVQDIVSYMTDAGWSIVSVMFKDKTHYGSYGTGYAECVVITAV